MGRLAGIGPHPRPLSQGEGSFSSLLGFGLGGFIDRVSKDVNEAQDVAPLLVLTPCPSPKERGVLFCYSIISMEMFRYNCFSFFEEGVAFFPGFVYLFLGDGVAGFVF
ncbi:hypothetical protein [uncultured Planktosalinus sp.]|uniref:hypothetical protein n=1 Tax=uncultured Planktosalinus sp. TaxID=1810935 RepID=UPI0030DA6FDE